MNSSDNVLKPYLNLQYVIALMNINVNNISAEDGYTAINIQSMVFGNPEINQLQALHFQEITSQVNPYLVVNI